MMRAARVLACSVVVLLVLAASLCPVDEHDAGAGHCAAMTAVTVAAWFPAPLGLSGAVAPDTPEHPRQLPRRPSRPPI